MGTRPERIADAICARRTVLPGVEDYLARCHNTTNSPAKNTGIVIANTRINWPTRRSVLGISDRIFSPCSSATALACCEKVTGRSYGGTRNSLACKSLMRDLLGGENDS